MSKSSPSPLLDLEEPRFTQAEVLQLLPDLPAKTLQNWAERGLLDLHDPNPGRQGKRLYTPIGVILLGAMSRLVSFGIGPTNARDIVDPIGDRALGLHRQDLYEAGPDGEWKIVLDGGRLETYLRGYIYRKDAGYEMKLGAELLGTARLGLPWDYHVIEVDLMTIGLLNRMHRMISGLDPLDSANDPEPAPSAKSKGRKK